MAFSQATIESVRTVQEDADLLVSWESSSPPGTVFQVYLSGVLVWHGTARFVRVPYPFDGGTGAIRGEVGTVDPDEAAVDMSGSLPALGYSNRAKLTWYGGTYQGVDLMGFRVYRGVLAGDPVSYVDPVGSVTAYPQDRIFDGAGIGPAGFGGAGQAATTYSWTSPLLGPGTWNFGVKPVDTEGNEGTAVEIAFVSTAPPLAPARNADGQRLTVSAYNSTTRVATLSWLASPPY